MKHATAIRRLAFAGVLLGFVVVVLGAYVRLTAAGLGCPDWPGCYGHFTPAGAQAAGPEVALEHGRPLELGKAWREMVHRYAAATLGLIVVAISVLAWRNRRERVVNLPHAFGLLALILVQGLLGMLTVTWQLKPLIVTLHLLFGLSTVALLWWLWLMQRQPNLQPSDKVARAGRGMALFALLVLGMQIALGGWTSSNYAAVACPDFPQCQAAWWPQTDFRAAFVLWRGLGVNYEGGVLDHPARVAIHFTHRLGAIAATLALLLATLRVLTCASTTAARRAAVIVLVALTLQLCIGIAMVKMGFPLWLATAHNAGAALLLLSALGLLATLRRQITSA